MYLSILLIPLKMSDFSLSGSILINSQPSSVAFLSFLISYAIFLLLCLFLSVFLQIYSHENINQSDNLAHYILFDFFIFVSTDCSLVKITPYYLNPNLVLGLYPAVILQSMVTLFAILLCKKILLGCFFWFNC